MGSCILYIEKRNGSAAVGVRKWKGALSVNIAYFLLPKSRIAYLYDDFTFRQGLEKMRNRGYTAIPVITRDGRYVGTVSEGDFLWRLLDTDDPSMKKAEELVYDFSASRTDAIGIVERGSVSLIRIDEEGVSTVLEEMGPGGGLFIRFWKQGAQSYFRLPWLSN